MIIYEIGGMTCNGCLNKVRAGLQQISSEVSVTLNPPVAAFSGQTSPDLGAVRAALAAIGNYTANYTASPAALPGRPPIAAADERGWLKTYYPLLLIILYLAIVSLVGTFSPKFDLIAWMNHFMAGFFLVFSFFKLLDLKGFAESYASYDLLAARWPAYGLLYPFIELALGLAYLFNFEPGLTNIATILVMGFSSLGVIKALSMGQKIRCACLGTVLNLPMSTVTLVEDAAMVVMAAMALAQAHG